MQHQVYLSTGTNLGNRLENLRSAEIGLSQIAKVEMKSSVYETQPWGFTDQPAFLNQVLYISTHLDPFDLLDAIKRLEVEIGRTPTFRYGPRIIDIDILFYDKLILDNTKLTIPHPHLFERAFVLVPLNEIAAQFVHPGLHRTIEKLIATIDTSQVVLFQSQTN